MTIETGLLFAAIACALGLAGFFGGRQSAAKNDGERWGELKADIRHMKDDISDIKLTLEKNTADTKLSIRRLHERIDEHLRHDHGISTPNHNE